MTDYFYCYSYKLMYFIKSNGIDYIRYGFNRNNNLKYYLFAKTDRLNQVLCDWNNLKEKRNGL